MFAKAAHLYNVPSLIGSIGGDGENAHVDKAAEIIAESVKKNGYRPLKIIKIYAEIPKDLVHQKLRDGLVVPCRCFRPRSYGTRYRFKHPNCRADGPGALSQGDAREPRFRHHHRRSSVTTRRPYAAFCVFHGLEDLGTWLPSYPWRKLAASSGSTAANSLFRCQLRYGKDHGNAERSVPFPSREKLSLSSDPTVSI